MILTIRTDKPEAEVALLTTEGKTVGNYVWLAHRELSATLLTVIRQQLDAQKTTLDSLTGIIVFKGPGSFTGLRIGITVANTLAYGLTIPVVGTVGSQWQQDGIAALQKGQNNTIVIPEYGADAHITKPKK